MVSLDAVIAFAFKLGVITMLLHDQLGRGKLLLLYVIVLVGHCFQAGIFHLNHVRLWRASLGQVQEGEKTGIWVLIDTVTLFFSSLLPESGDA